MVSKSSLDQTQGTGVKKHNYKNVQRLQNGMKKIWVNTTEHKKGKNKLPIEVQEPTCTQKQLNEMLKTSEDMKTEFTRDRKFTRVGKTQKKFTNLSSHSLPPITSTQLPTPLPSNLQRG